MKRPIFILLAILTISPILGAQIQTSYTDRWNYDTPQMYVFNGTKYARYDIKANKIAGVNEISKGYAGVPFTSYDATYVDTWSYPTPQLYIFSGTRYARYDIKENKFMGVNDIAKGFPGLPFATIQAAYVDNFSYPTPQLYVFSGKRYARYDINNNKTMGENDIAAGYPGVPFATFDSVDVDTISYPTPQLYIYSGTKYCRFDIKENKVMGVNDILKGYPGLSF